MNGTLANGTSSLPNTSAADDPILTAVHSINLILGLPVNTYTMWLILSGTGGTMASELLFLNLIVSVVTSPLATVFYFAWLYDVPGMAWARVWAILLFYAAVPSFQCCICVERYIAVVHPVVFLRYKALGYRVACCCVVWPMLLAFSVVFTVYSSSVILGCSVLLGVHTVCISAVSYCCFSVLRALKQPAPGTCSVGGRRAHLPPTCGTQGRLAGWS